MTASSSSPDPLVCLTTPSPTSARLPDVWAAAVPRVGPAAARVESLLWQLFDRMVPVGRAFDLSLLNVAVSNFQPLAGTTSTAREVSQPPSPLLWLLCHHVCRAPHPLRVLSHPALCLSPSACCWCGYVWSRPTWRVRASSGMCDPRPRPQPRHERSSRAAGQRAWRRRGRSSRAAGPGSGLEY